MRYGKNLLAVIAAVAMLLFGGSALAAGKTLTLPQALRIVEEEAFYGDMSIGKVVLPEGTTEIRARAFAGSALEEINLPESLTFIAEDAFDGPEKVSVNANPGTYAFEWATNHGYIQDNSKDYVFTSKQDGYYVSGYTGTSEHLVLPKLTPEGDTVKGLVDRCFENNKSIKTVVIPGYFQIAQRAFYNCTSLETVEMQDGTIIVGWNCFEGCTSLRSVKFANTISYMFEDLFSGCTNLKKLVYPISMFIKPDDRNWTQGWAYKYHSALYGSSVDTVIIPEGAATIFNNSFANATSLKHIYIPSTVGNVDPEGSAAVAAFAGIKNSITIHGKAGSFIESYANEHGILFSTEPCPALPEEIIRPASVSLSEEYLLLSVGETACLNAEILPIEATERTVMWKSDNEKVAMVSDAGVVTAVGHGTCGITVTTSNGLVAYAMVCVSEGKSIPDTPKLMSANLDQDGNILVCWEKVEGAQGYYVYFAAGDEADFAVAYGEKSESAVIKAMYLESSTTYSVSVCAFNSDGISVRSDSISVTIMGAPAAPEIEQITPGISTLDVKWSAVENADGYKLYCSKTAKIPAKPYGIYASDINQASVETLDEGTEYYIWVSAYNREGETFGRILHQAQTERTDFITIDVSGELDGSNWDTAIRMPFVGGSETYAVNSNKTWTVTVPEWLEVTPTTGSGYCEVTITAHAVPETIDWTGRTETVVFNCGSASEMLWFTQDAAPYVSASMENKSAFAAAGGSRIVFVEAESNWTATSSDEWVTVSPTSGYGNCFVTLYVDKNSTTEERSAFIDFESKGFVTLISQVDVTQEAGGNPSHLPDTTIEAPTLTNVTVDGYEITAQWTTVDNAVGYHLYYLSDFDIENNPGVEMYIDLADPDCTSHTFSVCDDVYYISVAAVDKYGEESIRSNMQSINVAKPVYALEATDICEGHVTDDSITISWREVTTPMCDVVGYNVYYSTRNSLTRAKNSGNVVHCAEDQLTTTIEGLRDNTLYYLWVETEAYNRSTEVWEESVSEPMMLKTDAWGFSVRMSDPDIESYPADGQYVHEFILPDNSTEGYTFEMNISSSAAWSAGLEQMSRTGWLSLSSYEGGAGDTSITFTVEHMPPAMKSYSALLKLTLDDGGQYLARMMLHNTQEQTEQVKVSSIEINGGDQEAWVGQPRRLTAMILPADATDKSLAWTVKNGTGSASINAETGLLNPLSVGDVTITASSLDGSGVSSSVTVAIIDGSEDSGSEVIDEMMLSGSFAVAEDSVTLGDAYQLKGYASVSGSRLKSVKMTVDGYRETEDEDYLALDDMYEMSIQLEDYQEFSIDTSDANMYPLNQPGTYTIKMFVSEQNGAWQDVAHMTLNVTQEEAQSSATQSPIISCYVGSKPKTNLVSHKEAQMGYVKVRGEAVSVYVEHDGVRYAMKKDTAVLGGESIYRCSEMDIQNTGLNEYTFHVLMADGASQADTYKIWVYLELELPQELYVVNNDTPTYDMYGWENGSLARNEKVRATGFMLGKYYLPDCNGGVFVIQEMLSPSQQSIEDDGVNVHIYSIEDEKSKTIYSRIGAAFIGPMQNGQNLIILPENIKDWDTYTLYISSNCNWEITNIPDWMAITESSQTGNAGTKTVPIVFINMDSLARNDVLEISFNNGSLLVSIAMFKPMDASASKEDVYVDFFNELLADEVKLAEFNSWRNADSQYTNKGHLFLETTMDALDGKLSSDSAIWKWKDALWGIGTLGIDTIFNALDGDEGVKAYRSLLEKGYLVYVNLAAEKADSFMKDWNKLTNVVTKTDEWAMSLTNNYLQNMAVTDMKLAKVEDVLELSDYADSVNENWPELESMAKKIRRSKGAEKVINTGNLILEGVTVVAGTKQYATDKTLFLIALADAAEEVIEAINMLQETSTDPDFVDAVYKFRKDYRAAVQESIQGYVVSETFKEKWTDYTKFGVAAMEYFSGPLAEKVSEPVANVLSKLMGKSVSEETVSQSFSALGSATALTSFTAMGTDMIYGTSEIQQSVKSIESAVYIKELTNTRITRDLQAFKSEPTPENAVRLMTDIKLLKSYMIMGEQCAETLYKEQIDRETKNDLRAAGITLGIMGWGASEWYHEEVEKINAEAQMRKNDITKIIEMTNSTIESFKLPE